ncbi:hypothetical protein AMTRI_Chr02g259550 [Amborella trichopoda]
MLVPSKKVFEDANCRELMVIEPNEAHPTSQPLVSRSGGSPLPSRGDSCRCELIVMGNRAFSLATLRRGLAISARREPIIDSTFVVTSFSRQVIHPIVWCIRGGFVVSQVVMPFPTQVIKLNCRIVSADNGRDLLSAAYQLFSWASFFELIMFPFLAKRLMDNLQDFNVPCVD